MEVEPGPATRPILEDADPGPRASSPESPSDLPQMSRRWQGSDGNRTGRTRLGRRSRTGIVAVMTFTRITADAERMGGVPCVRDLRFPVASVVAMVADAMSVAEILAEHPDLEAEDIAECLRYAALAVQERELPLLRSA